MFYLCIYNKNSWLVVDLDFVIHSNDDMYHTFFCLKPYFVGGKKSKKSHIV